jgi:hypothetical protein
MKDKIEKYLVVEMSAARRKRDERVAKILELLANGKITKEIAEDKISSLIEQAYSNGYDFGGGGEGCQY